MKYRKKPIVIEAVRFMIDDYLPDWFMDNISQNNIITYSNGMCDIKTLEGTMRANFGDYIICGVNGELYPCKPDIFEKTYEVVKMLSKELCEKALEWAKTCYFEDTEGNKYSLESYSGFKCLEQLIKEHFELVEKYNTLLTRFNALENPQPYKFEELKEGMAYYHSKLNKVCLLVSKKDKDCIILSVCSDDGGSNIVYIEFQKNSFFPVEKANVRCE